MRARLRSEGSREPVAWAQMQLSGSRLFVVFSQKARARGDRR